MDGRDTAGGALRVRVEPGLRMFLTARNRVDELRVPHDGTSSLRHVVQSLGVPLTEVGALRVDGREVAAGHRPAAGETVEVLPVRRPQRLPRDAPRTAFVLDVHLGTLARRLRLLGVDTAYRNDADDAELVAQANAERRILLTRDRGLLRRRALRLGGYVRGARPGEQLADVLERFAPPLAPWTRCPACNGTLTPVAKDDIAHLLEPGTLRTYDEFARCVSCGRPYWRGAHAGRLDEIVTGALPAADAPWSEGWR